MKMMGLPNWLHWLAWFTKSYLFILISLIVMVALLKIKFYDQGQLAVRRIDIRIDYYYANEIMGYVYRC